MKHLITILFIVTLTGCLLAGCSSKSADNTAEATSAQTAAATSAAVTVPSSTDAGEGAMPTVINTAEYTLYQNIFFNDLKKDYSGKAAIKEGTFTTIFDAYNNVNRYYVWGYNDQTKCCDWQWELKIDDTSALPGNGSLIEVKGAYEENEAALDKFWIVKPEITVKTAYDGNGYDIDMLTMDNTLERVQTMNISAKKEAFEGKTVCCYGRILDGNTLQDPYYDNSWKIGISGDYDVPAFGTTVQVYGTVTNGALTNCTIGENTQY